jgi:hypothetical protein
MSSHGVGKLECWQIVLSSPPAIQFDLPDTPESKTIEKRVAHILNAGSDMQSVPTSFATSVLKARLKSLGFFTLRSL